VDDQYALAAEERARLRLPARFVIYSHDCPRHVVEAQCLCKDGTWAETMVQWPAPDEPTDSTELRFPGGRMLLGAGSWCHVILENKGQRYRLGADIRKIVVDRLLQGLVGPLEGAGNGQIEGATVHWFMSLAEEHTSLYVAPHSGGRTVFVQGASGALLARLDLSEQLVQEWVETLARAR
jgi:hypothetical protein